MGSPKALLTLHGRSFLSRLIEAFRAGGCDPVIVVTGPEDDADGHRIAEEARALGAEVAVNPDPSSDQIESLRAALAVVPAAAAAIIVSPVDSPGATASVVEALIEAARGGAPVVMPTFGGRRGHPALFSRELFSELRSGELPEGARTVIRRYEADLIEVPVAEPEVLLDVDTPADYQRLQGER